MRTIKFRGWNPETKEMKIALNVVMTEPTDYLTLSQDKLVLMQFTGLLDKNGVEIFEGDILATEQTENLPGIDTWEREILGDVYWNEKFACWNHRADLHDNDSIYNLNKYVFVLGNIYESPDLIHIRTGE